MFRKSLFESIGGLDPDLFWMEDTDFCYQFQKAGGKIHYVAQVEILHHSGKSSLKNLPVVITNQLISKIKYMKALTVLSFSDKFLIHIPSFTFTVYCVFIDFNNEARTPCEERRAYFFALRKYFDIYGIHKLRYAENIMKRILLLSDINSAHTQKVGGSIAVCRLSYRIFSLQPIRGLVFRARNSVAFKFRFWKETVLFFGYSEAQIPA